MVVAATKLSSRKVPEKKHTAPKTPKGKQAVLHVSQLPIEYTEKELRTFFCQFGRVTKLRLSRSNKTARSRGYAYIQYELPELAKIAAEATNNYFIGGKPIRVEHMNPEAVLPELFKGCKKTKIDPRPRRFATLRKGHNSKTHSIAQEETLKKDQTRASKLAAAGIDYDFTRRVITKVKKTSVVKA